LKGHRQVRTPGSIQYKGELRSKTGLRTKGARKKPMGGFKALVVDDDPVMCKLASAMLTKLGYCVCAVDDGAEALFFLQKSSCDLMLTDYRMPAINGYQLGRRVKSLFPETRVIIMTGMSFKSVASLVDHEEIDGWLFKPFYLDELRSLLSRIGFAANNGATHL